MSQIFPLKLTHALPTIVALAEVSRIAVIIPSPSPLPAFFLTVTSTVLSIACGCAFTFVDGGWCTIIRFVSGRRRSGCGRWVAKGLAGPSIVALAEVFNFASVPFVGPVESPLFLTLFAVSPTVSFVTCGRALTLVDG